ncbi:MAG: hypothetical protein IJ213_08540 [Bacteroidales bacterium]|nr:hypothetical protein [Bacteroidales bacterium]MBQ9313075.1 hypothetical protein [Bacteroidales bacterium]
MKIRHLVLGFALVAMMAACSKQAETTVSETANTETVEQQVSETVAEVTEDVKEEVKEVAKEAKTTPTKKQETTKSTSTQTAKADDGCEAKISAFEKYAYDLQTAYEKRATPAGLKALGTLVKDAPNQKAAVESCKANYDSRYKTALLKINTTLTNAKK